MDHLTLDLTRAQLTARRVDADHQRRARRAVLAARLSRRAQRAAQRAQLAADRTL